MGDITGWCKLFVQLNTPSIKLDIDIKKYDLLPKIKRKNKLDKF